MQNFIHNIEQLTRSNNNFRNVIFTGQYAQLVLMSLLPNEDIGMEVHTATDQFIEVEQGEGTVIINKQDHFLKDGVSIFVPAGTWHNIINSSPSNTLKLYTVYSPPHHKAATVQEKKQP